MKGFYLSPVIPISSEKVCSTTWHDIADACERGFIPRCIIDKAYDTYLQYKRLTTKRLKHLELIAFSIYVSLIENEIPRIPQEIEYLCDVPAGSISKIERVTSLGVRPPHHYQYTETFAARLNIPYKHVVKIKQLIRVCYELRMVRPQCLNAVMIYLYCQHANYEISMSSICSVCSVSPNTIKKLIRKLDPSKLKNFELMFLPV